MGREWGAKSISISVIVVISVLFPCVSATNHTVGGSTGWAFASNLQAWTSSTTFYPGDYLVFRYVPIHDVLEVNRDDFATCHTINPIGTYEDGETVIGLKQDEGGNTRFFICGRPGHCGRGLKLRVHIQNLPSNFNNSSPPPPPPSPPPPEPAISPPPLPHQTSEDCDDQCRMSLLICYWLISMLLLCANS
ncbi:Phytocyanin domain [Dillenia turbinata]|uniref:Phytocyanin domain n=1 Tax=Dillenia turbinata TaxID=194707 RepID=A0AAN8Z9G3_9MAGN